MKECTFRPKLDSHKTRLGRSLSPRRVRGEVFDELFKDAKFQSLARAQVTKSPAL